MVKTTSQLTFAEYLEYDDGTDKRYELLDGELISMPPESGLNDLIARFLLVQFMALVGLKRVIIHTLELQVDGNTPNRWPDLVILRPEHIPQLKKRQTLLLDMRSPLLVAEVVSPYRNKSDDNYRRDYVEKVEQYQARGIPEYWIIDPTGELVTVLVLKDDAYEKQEFRGNEQIVSEIFQDLELTVVEILQLGN